MPQLLSDALTFLVADVAATGKWYESNLGFTASHFSERYALCLCACSEMGLKSCSCVWKGVASRR
jgi:hypothetical protein